MFSNINIPKGQKCGGFENDGYKVAPKLYITTYMSICISFISSLFPHLACEQIRNYPLILYVFSQNTKLNADQNT